MQRMEYLDVFDTQLYTSKINSEIEEYKKEHIANLIKIDEINHEIRKIPKGQKRISNPDYYTLYKNRHKLYCRNKTLEMWLDHLSVALKRFS
jgi:hypothetical protein